MSPKNSGIEIRYRKKADRNRPEASYKDEKFYQGGKPPFFTSDRYLKGTRAKKERNKKRE